MDQTKADGYIVNLSRVLVFTLSVVLSLGWLVAPEAVNWARNLVAAYVHRAPEDVGNRRPGADASSTLPAAFVATSPFQKVAAVPHTDASLRGPRSAPGETDSALPVVGPR